MRRHLFVWLFLALLSAACSSSRDTFPAPPVRLDKAEADKVIREIKKERAETEEWLRSGLTSYLAAVDRVDFNGRKAVNIGSAADNDLRIPDPGIKPHHLRVTLDGDRFSVEAIDSDASFKIGEEVKREARLDPSYIQVDRFTLRLSHQNFPAVTLFDPRSPHYRKYKGLKYRPVDLSYRYELPLRRYPEQEKTAIDSTRGNRRAAERVGWVEFLAGKTPCRLEVIRLLEPGATEDELTIFFRDASSGSETYKVGRYVDLKKQKDGAYILDFNLAYNPACAFSSFYNCPIPPRSNILPVAIRAGELDSHYSTEGSLR